MGLDGEIVVPDPEGIGAPKLCGYPDPEGIGAHRCLIDPATLEKRLLRLSGRDPWSGARRVP